MDGRYRSRSSYRRGYNNYRHYNAYERHDVPGFDNYGTGFRHGTGYAPRYPSYQAADSYAAPTYSQSFEHYNVNAYPRYRRAPNPDFHRTHDNTRRYYPDKYSFRHWGTMWDSEAYNLWHHPVRMFEANPDAGYEKPDESHSQDTKTNRLMAIVKDVVPQTYLEDAFFFSQYANVLGALLTAAGLGGWSTALSSANTRHGMNMLSFLYSAFRDPELARTLQGFLKVLSSVISTGGSIASTVGGGIGSMFGLGGGTTSNGRSLSELTAYGPRPNPNDLATQGFTHQQIKDYDNHVKKNKPKSSEWTWYDSANLIAMKTKGFFNDEYTITGEIKEKKAPVSTSNAKTTVSNAVPVPSNDLEWDKHIHKNFSDFYHYHPDGRRNYDHIAMSKETSSNWDWLVKKGLRGEPGKSSPATNVSSTAGAAPASAPFMKRVIFSSTLPVKKNVSSSAAHSVVAGKPQKSPDVHIEPVGSYSGRHAPIIIPPPNVSTSNATSVKQDL